VVHPRRGPARPVSILRIRWAGDVELDRQQIAVCADRGCDLRGIAAGCDNSVAGRQSGLRDVGAQTATSAPQHFGSSMARVAGHLVHRS